MTRSRQPHAGGASRHTDRDFTFRCAAVLGLGLMGGSLARDLAARRVRVLGYDRDRSALDRARADGVLERALDDTLDGVEDADVVVFALPVGAAVELVARAAPRLGGARLVTDTGSTKRSIVAACEAAGIGSRFVGAHALAGDHRSGWSAARTGLFEGARVFLCAAPSTQATAIASAEGFWSSLGAHPEWIDAAAHDAQLAWSSHLPQLAASSLALALQEAGIARAQLGPGGRDSTRLAASAPDMWLAIARDNADHLAPALAALEQQLRRVRQALEGGDETALEGMLRTAQRWSS